MSQTQEITLSKGPHRLRFVWTRGEERALCVRLIELAREESVPLDWFDAALVAHQIAHKAKEKKK